MSVAYFRRTTSTKKANKTDAVYATVHDAANADSLGTGADLSASNTYLSNSTYYIQRGFLYFDSIDLPNDAVITAARIRLESAARAQADAGHSDLHIVQGIQNDPLVVSDYGAHLSQTTSGGSVAYADIPSPLAFYWLALNATGLTWINLTGVTLFCLRLSGDIDNLTPTGTNGVGAGDYTAAYSNGAYITTLSASNVLVGSATLRGTFDYFLPPTIEVTYTGTQVTYPRFRFSYFIVDQDDEPVGGVHTTTWQSGVVWGATVSENITGLIPNRLYKFRFESDHYGVLHNGVYKYFTTSTNRVTAIVHRYNRMVGIYTIEASLGEVVSDFGVPDYNIKTKSITPQAQDDKLVRELEKEVGDKLIEYYKKIYGARPPEPPEVIPKPRILPGVVGAGGMAQEKWATSIWEEAKKAWPKITPWKEEAGETFGAEAMERLRQIPKIPSPLGLLVSGVKRITQTEEGKKR